MSLIEIKDLSCSYRKRPALQNFSLSLEPGHVVGILGINGAGKSTLFKILAGVMGGFSGSVLVDGKVPGLQTKPMTAYLPEQCALDEALTPLKLIEFFSHFFEDFEKDTAQRAMQTLEVPLDLRLSKMSKGMRDKVQIVLTMSRRAKVYLLDEPGTGVDLVAKDLVLQSIISRFRADALILICTHRIADFEPILDTAVFMKDGAVNCIEDCEILRSERGIGLEDRFRELFGKQTVPDFVWEHE